MDSDRCCGAYGKSSSFSRRCDAKAAVKGGCHAALSVAFNCKRVSTKSSADCLRAFDRSGDFDFFDRSEVRIFKRLGYRAVRVGLCAVAAIGLGFARSKAGQRTGCVSDVNRRGYTNVVFAAGCFFFALPAAVVLAKLDLSFYR